MANFDLIYLWSLEQFFDVGASPIYVTIVQAKSVKHSYLIPGCIL